MVACVPPVRRWCRCDRALVRPDRSKLLEAKLLLLRGLMGTVGRQRFAPAPAVPARDKVSG